MAAAAVSRRLTYYSAWFCPFAHRTTLALEHHGLEYEWVEALGWETRQATGAEAFTATERREWQYHWKHPDLLKANPDGMIPTLVLGDKTATESIACMELIDDLGRETSSKRLVPEDPWLAADVRVWAEKVNKTICSEYYNCLVKDADVDRKEAFERLVNARDAFAERLEASSYFAGRQEPSLVDFVLLPYAYRFYVLDHYRGFTLPPNDKYDAWLDRCLAMPGVEKTLPDRDRYLKHIDKYATGRARSKVANAVRRGKSAHEYDHSLDG
mmetsp:Transcript_17284/g.56176  ORF Transcript_17284/g.56176 Transcript_17284/m.56176 type:complete len:270 (+) Transcript_17284:37-846(+)